MGIRSFFLILVLFSLMSCGHAPAPAIHYGQSSGAGSAGMHHVLKGDTLYSISSRYRLAMRDIIVLNNLKPPFNLYEGQRIRLPPPQEYRVRGGDTLYEVSRLFGVNSSEIAQLNNLQSPYILKPGQVLRLPSVTRKINRIAAVKSSVDPVERTVLPSEKPARVFEQAAVNPEVTEIQNGVPIPKNKPVKAVAKGKTERLTVSKVGTKTPKRAAAKFLRPVDGKIISNYGVKKSGLHNDGVNIEAKRGTSVKAADNGVVVYAGNALKGSGNLVLLRHDDQWMTAYAHLDKITVREGQTVNRGSAIGKVGSTGSVSSPQLHFEVRRGTSALNPNKHME